MREGGRKEEGREDLEHHPLPFACVANIGRRTENYSFFYVVCFLPLTGLLIDLCFLIIEKVKLISSTHINSDLVLCSTSLAQIAAYNSVDIIDLQTLKS